MRSDRPKPLHMICGRAMVLHVIDATRELRPVTTALVVGHAADRVMAEVSKLAPPWANLTFVEQVHQRGTGDAAAVGMTALPGDDLDDESTVVVLPGDTPLLRPATLDELVATHVANDNAATLLTAVHGRSHRLRPGGPRHRRAGAAHRRAARRQPRRAGGAARCAPASTPSAATSSARRCAGCRPTTPRASTTSPTSSASLAGMGHRVGVVQAPAERDPGRQRPLAARPRRARAAGAHQPSLAAERRHDARPAPDVRRRHRRSSAVTSRCTRARCSTAPRWSATAASSARTPASPTARSAAGRAMQYTVGTSATIGDGAAVGPFAHLAPGSVVEANADTGPFYTGRSD